MSTPPAASPRFPSRPADPFADEVRRRADRISSLILYSDYPWIDIDIEIDHLREFVLENAPEKIELFEGLYRARFERLREQWGRSEEWANAPDDEDSSD